MDDEGLQDLLDTLSNIASYKSMLPFGLRGWVNALGLHVQERHAGRWARLQAGGSVRSYLDAWREEEGNWEVRKFDQQTWGRRFAHVVEPTENIANYVCKYGLETGSLDSGKIAVLRVVIACFEFEQVWLWLPGVPVHLEKASRQMAQLEPRKLDEVVSYSEILRVAGKYPLDQIAGLVAEATQTNPEILRVTSKDPFDWQFLAMLYDLAGRYKEMEDAIKIGYDLDRSQQGGSEEWGWRWRCYLGMLYFAATSNSKGGQSVVVLGSVPSRVTPESLGYTIDQVLALANEYLERAHADAERAWYPESPEVKQMEQAIATLTLQTHE